MAKTSTKSKDVKLAKLAKKITEMGGGIDAQGNLNIPLKGKQVLHGFDGNQLKGTLSPAIQLVVDIMLDKREALENTKNALENAVEKVESEMNAEGVKTVTALDRHNRKFTITLKPGKTKLEVKAVK